jgi:thiol:disulfide interchange protein
MKRWRSYLFIAFILLPMGAAGIFLFNDNRDQTGTSTAERYKTARAEGRPLLVYFTSEYCPQCKVVSERIAQVNPAYFEKVVFLEVDIHQPENRSVMKDVGVISVPTLAFYDSAGSRQIVLGMIELEDLEARLAQLAESAENVGP